VNASAERATISFVRDMEYSFSSASKLRFWHQPHRQVQSDPVVQLRLTALQL
jgi:hypothetical protein